MAFLIGGRRDRRGGSGSNSGVVGSYVLEMTNLSVSGVFCSESFSFVWRRGLDFRSRFGRLGGNFCAEVAGGQWTSWISALLGVGGYQTRGTLEAGPVASSLCGFVGRRETAENAGCVESDGSRVDGVGRRFDVHSSLSKQVGCG